MTRFSGTSKAMVGRFSSSSPTKRWSFNAGSDASNTRGPGTLLRAAFPKEKIMPLENFGSILTFAAEMESLDQAYYGSAAQNPSCAGTGKFSSDSPRMERRTKRPSFARAGKM